MDKTTRRRWDEEHWGLGQWVVKILKDEEAWEGGGVMKRQASWGIRSGELFYFFFIFIYYVIVWSVWDTMTQKESVG